jgi:hypothetical protein
MFALQDFEAHPNNARKNDIRGNSIGNGQGQNPGQSLVCKIKDNKDNQPNAHNAQRYDEQAAEEAYQQSHQTPPLLFARLRQANLPL